MTADNHIHTSFSPDGKGNPEDFVLRAIELKLEHVAFTEHADLLYFDPSFQTGDLTAYFAHMRMLKEKYAGRISIAAGLEIGYTNANKTLNAELIKKHRPDYVINSVHEADGSDPYYPQYFVGKTPYEAVSAYLKAVLDSLDAPYEYNAVGHLGYVTRKAPFNDSVYSLRPDLVDEILGKTVAKGKILEINTSGYKSGEVLPPREIILRYAALGGKKLCFASDAHTAQDLCRNYEAARSLAAEAGILCQTAVIGGKESELPF